MEQKKTAAADLEHIRPWAFFLGLVTATVLFFLTLEIPFSERSSDFDSDFLDEIAEDMEMLPPIQEDLIPELNEQEEIAPTEIVVVENAVQNTAQEEEILPPPEITLETDIDDIPAEDKVEAVTIEEAQQMEVPVDALEALPQFPGGMSQLMKWLTQNLKYPEKAKNDKISGKVVVEFIITDQGKVANPKVIQKVDEQLDREALRVIGMMPQWKPGVSKGKPCRTLVHMPVVFKL